MTSVLIVDDNKYNLAVLRTGLAEEHYTVHEAMSGVEALAKARSTNPDIILLDVLMPNMSGFEVCLQLKKDTRTCDIPVIFVTSLDENINKLHGFEVGGEDYITKPFMIEEVIARVRVHITLREQKELLETRNREDTAYFALVNKFKDDLMHQLKHDVRNPVSSLLLSIQLIQKQYQVDAQLMEYASRMKESSQEILRLVDNLMEIAKLEAGRTVQQQSSVDLHGFLQHICLLFYPHSEARSIGFYTDFSCVPKHYQAAFNENQLTSVLSNLLTNAFKYTPSHGIVRFVVLVDEHEVLFQISDTGYGISEEDLPFVFQRFYRAKQTRNMIEGTGLGLYLVKSIVEQHHGRVWVESKLGEGSTFYVSIPN